MRLSKAVLRWYRSVDFVEFELNQFTVLFGKNNAGKTNLLESIYGIFAPDEMPGILSKGAPARGLRGSEDSLGSSGAVHVELERGIYFDDSVQDLDPRQDGSVSQLPEFFDYLPPSQAWFIEHSGVGESSLLFADPTPLYRFEHDIIQDGCVPEESVWGDLDSLSINGPRPRPLFLGWEFEHINTWVTDELLHTPDSKRDGPQQVLGQPLSSARPPWLELVDDSEPPGAWRIRPELRQRVQILGKLATIFLPDFIDGSIEVDLVVPTQWGSSPSVEVYFRERGGTARSSLEDSGRGAFRWMAIAVQTALHVLQKTQAPEGIDQDQLISQLYSSHVLFVDEPEAHLHPSAVGSVVRWCQKMVGLGFQVIAASHHEEFLRATGPDVTFVKVSRDPETGHTTARSVPAADTPVLQEMAAEVGMHPAAALSLHRAVLFVEGTLDVAVLDEFAGAELDAAGILIIPIHGTRNLEGLIDGEFTTRLGIKTGVLTDNTITATMSNRSNRKRSSEEVKIVRLIKRYEDQGLTPPTAFGVPEDDLLFALPEEAIREYLKGPFPGWHELRDECRAAEGLGPSDSVDWKSYAETRYGLPITTPSGVRTIVRALDLAGVELPSIRAVVDQVIDWAK